MVSSASAPLADRLAAALRAGFEDLVFGFDRGRGLTISGSSDSSLARSGSTRGDRHR